MPSHFGEPGTDALDSSVQNLKFYFTQIQERKEKFMGSLENFWSLITFLDKQCYKVTQTGDSLLLRYLLVDFQHLVAQS